MSERAKQVRLFISHAGVDKPFVRRLVADLRSHTRKIWFDEQELSPGDSIVSTISDALGATDYLLIVLSRASVTSRWVRAELNAALIEELSDGGVVVLPALIEDCEIPPLLRDRIYADFRTDYDAGLASLLRVLDQERYSAAALASPPRPAGASLFPGPCTESLGTLRLADLRRLITKRMGRSELAVLWFDTFEERMDDDMAARTKVECVIELLERARTRKLLDLVISNLCAERPDLAQ